jgi:hypothetical protein
MTTNEHLEKIKAKLEELIVRYKSGTGGAPLAIAGWKSTLEEIAKLKLMLAEDIGWRMYAKRRINEILAAYPVELLT